MTSAALPPDLALAYLRALSTDVRDAAVADAGGAPLAGDPALLELAASAPDGGPAPGGHLHVARDEDHAVVVLAGPHALPGVLAHDLRAVLGDLRTR